jgi:hypothetical protein
MGHIYAEIELKNGVDIWDSKQGRIDPDLVRKIRVSARVAKGSTYMCINENIQEYLRLPVMEWAGGCLRSGRAAGGPFREPQ